MFVLKRCAQDGGGYVAPPGACKSYVFSIKLARIFASAQRAQAEACGNESVAPLAGEFRDPETRELF